jgi:hypothetical protein
MKRTVAFGALWTASAAAAVGLGFLAVSFVDADRTPLTQPVAATGSAATTPSAPSTPGDTSTVPVPAPEPPVTAPASGEYVTVGGTIYASCEGGVLQSAAAPAAGWWLDDQDHGGEVEFESPTQKVEVHVACADGTPSFFDEGVRADENKPEDSSSAAPASVTPGVPAPVTPGAGVDDSAGRVGGGHGSDDPPGDDSAGRVGGGHGSDDGPGDDRGRGRGSDD